MGTVYRARDRYSGDLVALKLLHAGGSSANDPDGERFAREAQILAGLHHPGIVSHVAHGQAPDGQRYLAMEWLEGEDLGQRLARGPLSIGDCLLLLRQVAVALALTHRRDIIHRDIKPTNLFLVGKEVARIKILDFGIARQLAGSAGMTRTGMVVGTPEYMAPEQARGVRDLTPAADLFSLGCVLYECLTGQPPFVAESIAAVLVRILFEAPVPVGERRPGVPASIVGLIDRLLAKDPAQRLRDAGTLGEELSALGELREPMLERTVANALTIAQPAAVGFAEDEQNLFSLVLAAPAEGEGDVGADATLRPSNLPQGTERESLVRALQPLGVSVDFLATGAVLVMVPSLGSALDQVMHAARAALIVKERWPVAQVSVATGRGAMRGQTAVGEVAELAARSLQMASSLSTPLRTMGVILDTLSAKLLAGRFVLSSQPGGIALLFSEERDADSSRLLLGRPTPCVGRDTELNLLDGQLTGCIEESAARVVLVTAPPGMGKSRLRHEFLRRVEKRDDGITVLGGRGEPMSAGTPYGMLNDALWKVCQISGSDPSDQQRARLRSRIAQHLTERNSERVVVFLGEMCNLRFPDSDNPILQVGRQDPKLMRDQIRRAFLDWMAAECAAGPVLLILDDLQWGDELTLSVLDHALAAMTDAPLMVLGLARPEVHQTFAKLWRQHNVQEITLKALSKKACERLLLQILGKGVSPEIIARAVQQSAGNALFLEELIRSIAEGKSEEQPDTVVAMLQSRVGRLDAGARRVVRAAALFGQTFWSGSVRAILGVHADSSEIQNGLMTLVEAELIHRCPDSRLPEEQEFRFRHALVRDAVYGLLTATDLRIGHRAAAAYLATAGEKDAAVIAEHYELGGEPQKSAGWFRRAAEQALDAGDFATVLTRVRRAIACGAADELLSDLKELELDAYRWQGSLDELSCHAAEAMSLFPLGSAAWCKAAAEVAVAGGPGTGRSVQTGQLTALEQTLLELPSDRVDAPAYVRCLARVLTQSCMHFWHERVSLLFDKMQAVLEESGLAQPVVLGWTEQAHAFRTAAAGQLDATLRHFRRARYWFEEGGDRRNGLAQAADEGFALVEVGLYHEAIHLLTAVVPQTESLGISRIASLARMNLGISLARVGRLNDALVTLQAAIDGFAAGQVHRVLATNYMAIAYRLAGRPEAAEGVLRTAIAAMPSQTLWDSRSTLAQVLLDQGRNAEAFELVKEPQTARVVLTSSEGGVSRQSLVKAESLWARGERQAALDALQHAVRDLQARAAQIGDPEIRQSYLQQVPDHARLLMLTKACVQLPPNLD